MTGGAWSDIHHRHCNRFYSCYFRLYCFRRCREWVGDGSQHHRGMVILFIAGRLQRQKEKNDPNILLDKMMMLFKKTAFRLQHTSFHKMWIKVLRLMMCERSCALLHINLAAHLENSGLMLLSFP